MVGAGGASANDTRASNGPLNRLREYDTSFREKTRFPGRNLLWMTTNLWELTSFTALGRFMDNIVGIRFREGGKIYHFVPGHFVIIN